MINSPEYKDFYKDDDFVGSYTNKNVNLVMANTSHVSFQGYLKGSGFVEYTSGSAGATANKPWGISLATGAMGGSASKELKSGFYAPSILEGVGTQVGAGLSGKGFGGEGGKWLSWNKASDVANGKATFSGWFGGITVGIDAKKLFKNLPSPSSGASGGASTSYSTLVPRRAPNTPQQ